MEQRYTSGRSFEQVSAGKAMPLTLLISDELKTMLQSFSYRNGYETDNDFIARCIYDTIRRSETGEAVVTEKPGFQWGELIDSLNGICAQIQELNTGVLGLAKVFEPKPESTQAVPTGVTIADDDFTLSIDGNDDEGEWITTYEAAQILGLKANFLASRGNASGGVFSFEDCPRHKTKPGNKKQRYWLKPDVEQFKENHPELGRRNDLKKITSEEFARFLGISRNAFNLRVKEGRYGRPDIPRHGSMPAMWDLERVKMYVLSEQEKAQEGK